MTSVPPSCVTPNPKNQTQPKGHRESDSGCNRGHKKGHTWRATKRDALQLVDYKDARVAKLADARDLKSRVPKGTYRFNSGPGHHVKLVVGIT
jgi:hypothetical protein